MVACGKRRGYEARINLIEKLTVSKETIRAMALAA